MKSPIMDRRVLLDIGAAGPIAGMIAAVPVVVAGLAVSEVRPGAAEGGIELGTIFALCVP